MLVPLQVGVAIIRYTTRHQGARHFRALWLHKKKAPTRGAAFVWWSVVNERRIALLYHGNAVYGINA